MAYSGSRDYENALRFVTKAIDVDPGIAAFRLHRAEIRHLSGDDDGALSELHSLLRENLPEDIKVRAEQLVAKLEGQS